MSIYYTKRTSKYLSQNLRKLKCYLDDADNTIDKIDDLDRNYKNTPEWRAEKEILLSQLKDIEKGYNFTLQESELSVY